MSGNNQSKENNSLALVSMITGIASWVILPLVGAIAAIICGHMAKSQIKRERNRYDGDGMATAGLITGYLNVVAVVALVGISIMAAVAMPAIAKAQRKAKEAKAKAERIEQRAVKAEEARRKAEVKKAPEFASDIDKYIHYIRNGEDRERKASVRAFEKMPVNESRKAEVAELLGGQLKDSDVFVRMAAIKALKRWHTKENARGLADSMEDESFVVRHESIKILATYQSKDIAVVIAKNFKKDKMQRKKALISMGAVAEEAAWELLEQAEWGVRADACDILKNVGSKRSVPYLQKATSDDSGIVKMRAERAIEEISKR